MCFIFSPWRVGVYLWNGKLQMFVPVHKEGPSNRVENYRPISFLCTWKMLEQSNLITQLNAENFFISCQHDFRGGVSCDTQLVEFHHHLALSSDKGHKVDCLSLDFQKAFDMVPHTIVLHKLQAPNMVMVMSQQKADVDWRPTSDVTHTLIPFPCNSVVP